MKIKSILSIVSGGLATVSLAVVSQAAYAICPVGTNCVPASEPSILGLLGVGAAVIALAPLVRRKRK
jgi:hypothetical protein